MSDYVLPDVLCGACGKKTWFSKKRARAVRRAMRRRYGNDGYLRIYPGCRGGFHIGHAHRVLAGRPNLNDPRLHWEGQIPA